MNQWWCWMTGGHRWVRYGRDSCECTKCYIVRYGCKVAACTAATTVPTIAALFPWW